jgi:hypothetical protein
MRHLFILSAAAAITLTGASVGAHAQYYPYPPAYYPPAYAPPVYSGPPAYYSPPPQAYQPAPTPQAGLYERGPALDPDNCGTPDAPKACPPMPRVPLPYYPADRQ